MNRLLASLALPFAFGLSGCGDADDAADAGSVAPQAIPENQGMGSGTVGDGNPDVTKTKPDATPAPGETRKQVGGMSYPVTGQ